MIAILISIILGTIRIAGNTSILFQVIAHCWVGGLIGRWIGEYRSPSITINPRTEARRCGWLALCLTILEITCFVWFKYFAMHLLP